MPRPRCCIRTFMVAVAIVSIVCAIVKARWNQPPTNLSGYIVSCKRHDSGFWQSPSGVPLVFSQALLPAVPWLSRPPLCLELPDPGDESVFFLLVEPPPLLDKVVTCGEGSLPPRAPGNDP